MRRASFDRSPSRSVALALACAALVSCSGGDTAAVPEPPTTDPEFINGGGCPASRHDDLAEDAGCVSTVAEGDARLRVYALLDGDAKPRRWRMRFESGGDEIDQRLRAGNVTSYPRALGATDVNGDGTTEWWVKVRDYASHGAAWAGLELFVLDGDALVPIEHEGEPLTINFGGISRLGEGATCRNDRLVALRVWARDRQNTRWWISERTFSLEGLEATLVGRRRRSLEIESYADQRLARNYRVECHGETFTPY